MLKRALYRYKKNLVGMVSLVILICILLAGLLGPSINRALGGHDPNLVELGDKLLKPSSKYLLGTDDLGRDLLARLLDGAQVSIALALMTAVIALLIGGILGLVAGFCGGWIDDVIMTFTSALLSIPNIFLLILLSTVLQPSTAGLSVLIAVLSWMRVAKMVRGAAMACKEREYITAARSLGASPIRILFKHVLPNITPTLIVASYLTIADVLLRESALSYLGLGVQLPAASWGSMLKNSMTYIFTAPHLMLPPGVAIFLTVLSIYMIGDTLRDAFDPRMF